MPDITDVADSSAAVNPTGEAASTTRDYLKAILLIALIIGLVALAFWLAIGGFCACLTRPAG